MSTLSIDQFANYTPFGATFRDIGFAVGDQQRIEEADAGRLVGAIEQVMAHRARIKALGRAILLNPKAPHRKSPHDHVIYAGSVVGDELWLRAFPAFREAIKPQYHIAPHCADTTLGFLVYHLNKLNPEGTQWSCRPYHGDVLVYVNLYAPVVTHKFPLNILNPTG